MILTVPYTVMVIIIIFFLKEEQTDSFSVHYYNYVSDGWNSFTFPDTRFASEYGFQAMPSFLSIKAVSQSSDWGINSSFTKLRQHHPNGYSEMLAQIQLHFSLPKVDDSVEFFEKFIYYSQVSRENVINLFK